MKNPLAFHRRYLFRLFAVIFFLSFITPANTQVSRNAQEVWPSVDAYYMMHKHWRLYGTTSATKMDESNYSDGAIGLFVDYFSFPLGFLSKMVPGRIDSLPGKFLWFRAGYQYSATPPSVEDPFKESMIVTEFNPRFYLPFSFLITARNRFDWRINNGEFKARYRPKLVLERDFRTEYLFFTAYAFAEYFMNFGSPSVNKFRTQVGAEFRVTRHLNYEVFWNHQFAHDPEVQSVDAFGMTLKLYFDYQDKKKPKAQKKAPDKQAGVR